MINRDMGRRMGISMLVVALVALAGLRSALPVEAAQLVMFERKYCPWCVRWKKDIGSFYHKTDEGKIAPLRIVDMDEKRPDDLKDIRGLVWSPTFVLLDDDGREVGRMEGYQNEEAFWIGLDALIEKMKQGGGDREKDRKKTE